MNSDYVTTLRVEQHQADLRRLAQEHRVARASRSTRPHRAKRSWTSLWLRRETLPRCRPEAAGA